MKGGRAEKRAKTEVKLPKPVSVGVSLKAIASSFFKSLSYGPPVKDLVWSVVLPEEYQNPPFKEVHRQHRRKLKALTGEVKTPVRVYIDLKPSRAKKGKELGDFRKFTVPTVEKVFPFTQYKTIVGEVKVPERKNYRHVRSQG